MLQVASLHQRPHIIMYYISSIMTFDSVGGAEDGRTYKVRDEEVRTLRPSRLPNEFTRTGPNMPGILHYIKKYSM